MIKYWRLANFQRFFLSFYDCSFCIIISSHNGEILFPFLSIGNTTSPPLSTSQSVVLASLASVYFIIVFASIFGNSVIIHIIRTGHSLKTTTNYLILNQACADLIITFTVMLSMLGDNLFQRRWFGGDWGLPMCRLLVWFHFPAEYCSIWSLVAIAVDRYYAVARPLQFSPLSHHTRLVVSLIWVWSLSSAAGTISMAKLIFVEGTGHFCVVDYSHVELSAANVVSICVLLFNFVVPLLAMAVLYSIVCSRLLSREVPGDEAGHSARHAEAMKTAKKVNRMMILVVVSFTLCWFPFFIFVGLDSLHKIEIPYAALKFVVWLANAYSAINPYIYLSLSEKFRKEFMIILNKCRSSFSCG